MFKCFYLNLCDVILPLINKNIKSTLINIGTGKDLTIKKYVEMFLKILIPNKKIKIPFDRSKPNGTPRKLMYISLAKKHGCKHKTQLKDAIIRTYKDYSSINK